MKFRLVYVVFLAVCLFSAALILSEVHQLASFDFGLVSSTIGSLSSSTYYSSDAIEFEGASEFLSLLRKAYQKKIANPLPHCQRRRSNNATNEKEMKVEVFNRAIEIDWIGKNISAVEPTWSSPDRGSCNFAGLAFPPTKGTLHAALHQTTYISPFFTATQCKNSFSWESDNPVTCTGNNFGGTLGANTQQGCIEQSVSGYQMMLWNKQNSNDALLQCLKHYLRTDEVLRSVNITYQMEGLIANLTRMDYLSQRGYSHSNTDWSKLAFLHWTDKAMIIEDSALGIAGILQSAGINTTNYSGETARTLAGLLNAVNNGENSTFTKCVDGLLPPMIGKEKYSSEEERIWKETGAFLSASTMKESPSSLLRTFPGSLHGVLPPSPTAIYSVDALLGSVLNVDSEAYYPGCSPYWGSILRQGKSPKNAFKEIKSEADRNGTIFAHLKGKPNILRNEIIKTCAEDASKCPFPTYDLVIDVTQVYCGGFFHFTIESKCICSTFFLFQLRTQSH